MMLLTLALAAAIVRRPIRLTRGEVVSAVVWLASWAVCRASRLRLVVGGAAPEDGHRDRPAGCLLVGGAGMLGGLGAWVSARSRRGGCGHGPFVPRQDG